MNRTGVIFRVWSKDAVEESARMKIVVLNGSPKGPQSVTMQYVRYIEKTFSRHRFTYIDISEKIHRLEKSETAFREVLDAVHSADGIFWAFPLFYLLVPSQYKRFIELIRERCAEEAFRNKYAAVLTTSIHVHDTMAHHYMNAVCDDLGMRYAGSFSASMYDLLKEEQRKQLILFAKYFLSSIKKEQATPRHYAAVSAHPYSYAPGAVKDRLPLRGKKVLIVSDAVAEQHNLNRMIIRLQDSFSGYAETVNLNQLDIKGGCLGCLQCAYDNVCVYEGTDGFTGFFNEKIRSADVLVFAGAIRDRFLSSKWKCFFDRTFFNNHIPSMTGKQLGFLVSGPLGQLPELKQFLEAYVELQQGNLAGIVSDEYEDSGEIDGLITLLADRLIRYAVQGFQKPGSYHELGVRKILRDNIWKSMRFPFQSDHRYFKRQGLYDFPRRTLREKIRNLSMVMVTKVPFIRREIYTKQMKPGMIRPLEKVVAEADPEET